MLPCHRRQVMKILYYKTAAVEFKDPSVLTFSSSFDENFYKYCFNKITNNGDYRPYFNTDDFANRTVSLNIEKEFLKAGHVLPIASKKSSDKNLEIHQKIIRDFFSRFPEFVGLFENNTLRAEESVSNAEILLKSSVTSSNFIQIKGVIDEINRTAWSRPKNTSERQSGVSTLGSISEALLHRALYSLVDEVNFFKVTHPDVKSYGDFALMCLPNNLWLSVKSNFSRERLLASGYSNDILGVGFFEDAKEFSSLVRVRNFQRAGFLAIYCPDIPVSEKQLKLGTNTYCEIHQKYAKKKEPLPTNVNGGNFIRRLSFLHSDLTKILNVRDIKKRSTVKF